MDDADRERRRKLDLDRQRKLDEVCRRVLGGFAGRVATPLVIAEAEGAMRAALEAATLAGTYVLPDGLELDRVAVGADMRVKVFFRHAVTRLDAVAAETFDPP